MHISKEDKNPELYTETYDRWEDWMVGEVIYYEVAGEIDWGVVTKSYFEEALWAVWEKEEWYEMSIGVSRVRFKKRHTNKDSKVEVLAVKTVTIPTEIEFEGGVYVLKEGV